MNCIPVTLEHNGKKYEAELSSVMGAGSTTVWGLSVNGRDRGELHWGDRAGWRFHNQKGCYPDWAQVLGTQVAKHFPEGTFIAQLPPPRKLFVMEYAGPDGEGLLEIWNMQGGDYMIRLLRWRGKRYIPISELSVTRKRGADGELWWHYGTIHFRQVALDAGGFIDKWESEYEKDRPTAV